ncbi:hypothetical protein FQN54_004665 [Arachnomyces sp. PD_36]|nr:hypothetical protein FQN54_004665 [Arachnomyces sp. PD_36]
MRAASPLLSLTAWCSLSSLGVAQKFTRCATETKESFRSLAAAVVDDEARGAFDSIQESIEIDTYFHVVSVNDTRSVKEGYITDQMLDEQFAVLNEGYEPHQITFNLLNTTRTINPVWATNSSDTAFFDMKKALRKGTYSTLNVYFVGSMGDTLGFCPFPEDVKEGSDAFIEDGCIVAAGTVPGGTANEYNLGITLTHEVGHHLGLFHTFQDGCNGGDLVDDTPAQASATEGCPVSRDSCPAPGMDPIHNFMDYSTDICLNQFTPGQERRMYAMWNKFRADK